MADRKQGAGCSRSLAVPSSGSSLAGHKVNYVPTVKQVPTSQCALSTSQFALKSPPGWENKQACVCVCVRTYLLL